MDHLILFIAWKYQSLKKAQEHIFSFCVLWKNESCTAFKKRGWENGFIFGWTTPLTPSLIQCRLKSWKKVNSIPHIKQRGFCSRWPAVLSFARKLGGDMGPSRSEALFTSYLCGSRYGDKKDSRRMICASVLSRDRLWKSSRDKRLRGR